MANKHLLSAGWAKLLFVFLVLPFIAFTIWHVTGHEGRMHPSGRFTLGRDFINYWFGAKQAISGNAPDLYNYQLYFENLKAEFGDNLDRHNWSYPPHMLLFTWPLGLLSFVWAYAIWVAGGVVFFYYAVRKLLGSGMDAFVLVFAPVTFLCIYTGQNGLFTAALILLAFAIKNERPILAGMLIGCLTFKPQLGVLIPIVLLLARDMKAFASASVTTLTLVVISVLVFGVDVWKDFLFETLPLQGQILENYGAPWTEMVPSLFMTMKNIGLSADMAWVYQNVFSVLIVLSLVWGFVKQRSYSLQIALLCSSILLVMPYIANYDMAILAPAAYLYYRYMTEHRPGAQAPNVILVAIVCYIPWLGQVTAHTGIQAYFILLLVFHMAILKALSQSSIDLYSDRLSA